MISNHYFDLQESARNILLDETFSYAQAQMDKYYRELGAKNSKLMGTPHSNYFMYRGTIYPSKTENGTPLIGVTVSAAALHYSLYEEFDKIKQLLNKQFDYNQIKNFFTEVVAKSKNNLTFKELLPPLLINALQSKLKERNYTLLAQGPYDDYGQPIHNVSIEDTYKEIAEIKNQYADTIQVLKDQLINKFLLQE